MKKTNMQLAVRTLVLTLSFLLSCPAFVLIALAQSTPAYQLSVVKAVTNTKILPTGSVASIGSTINVTAAPGEYEAASFVVTPSTGVTGVIVASSVLTSGLNSIPVTAVDIRVVKDWYQAGVSEDDMSHKTLAPELLLKDDKLVKVDTSAQKNYLRQSDGSYILISTPNSGSDTTLANIKPVDASTLQPVDIDANMNKQFWVTVHVPDNAVAGTYTGAINLSGGLTGGIPISLTVLPFILEKSNLTYSIWDNSLLLGANTIDGISKDPTQYLAEAKNLKNHGVEYPIFNYRSNADITGALNLRKQAGLPLNGPVFSTIDPSYALYPDVQATMNEAKSFGVTDFYFYGADEAYGTALTNQRPDWIAVHNAGGKIFASVSDSYYIEGVSANPSDYDAFGKMGDLLDVAVEAGFPNSKFATEYHSVGHKVFSYSDPQTGPEEPNTFRNHFGLLLWKSGYDGAMDYAYHANVGSSWNDFDDTQAGNRDEMMVYPTTNGVIDTWEWEGFREGVDDTRYLATLQKAISDSTDTTLKTQAQNWLNSLTISDSTDLYAVRATMIDYITKLKGVTPPPPPAAVIGDLNGDSAVNATDFGIIKTDFLKLTAALTNPKSDIDSDGQVTIKDVGILMSGWK